MKMIGKHVRFLYPGKSKKTSTRSDDDGMSMGYDGPLGSILHQGLWILGSGPPELKALIPQGFWGINVFDVFKY